jgi:Gas vesicle protein
MTPAIAEREVALVDLLDRLLQGGVVLTGDLTLSIADVDLVRISLRALICSVQADRGGGTTRGQP